MNITHDRRIPFPSSTRTVSVAIFSVVALMTTHSLSYAGSVRVWPTAVVVGDSIHMDDLCELRGFDGETEKAIASLNIAIAPQPGGSRIVHLDMIRATLASNNINMAYVSLRGAIHCEVSRPGTIEPASNLNVPATNDKPKNNQSSINSLNTKTKTNTTVNRTEAGSTLRHAVVDFFNQELERFRGHAEVIFDHTSDQVLDLSSPQYAFHVRRRQNHPLGLIPLEVDVLAEGRTVQTVPLVVQVSMIHSGLVARRAINQGATIQATDVELVPLTLTNIDKLGMSNPTHAIGQRAKKFQAAGSLIYESDIESVPLVVRGQLVTLTSVSGSIQIVTTAKSAGDGLLGDLVKVRAVDNKRVEYDAVVVGPGKVQIGQVNVEPTPTIRIAGVQGS